MKSSYCCICSKCSTVWNEIIRMLTPPPLLPRPRSLPLFCPSKCGLFQINFYQMKFCLARVITSRLANFAVRKSLSLFCCVQYERRLPARIGRSFIRLTDHIPYSRYHHVFRLTPDFTPVLCWYSNNHLDMLFITF